MQPMTRLSMHSWTIQFFSFWGRGGGMVERDFLFFFSCSQCVPIMFPKCLSSQSVSKCVPRDVPNNALVLFNMVCSKFNSPVYKLTRWNPRVHIYFYFATGGTKRCFYRGHAQCSKKIANMPISTAHLKIKIKVVRACMF